MLSELGVLELVDRLLTLEHENELLKRALAGAFCGDVHDGKSCQLARGHSGDHVWMVVDCNLIVRWPRSSEDRTLGQ